MARWIKYIGTAHQRIITAENWRGVGVQADTVVWSAHNGFQVLADSFTEDQMRKAIDPDPTFVVTGEDDDFRPQSLNQDVTPAAYAQAIENPVDVVAMLNGADNGSTARSEASGGVDLAATDGPDDDKA